MAPGRHSSLHCAAARLRRAPQSPPCADLQIIMQTDLTSVYMSMAIRPCSRPMPDCLKPPNGMLGSTMLWQLTHTVPALMRGTKRCTADRLLDQMLAPKP